MRNSTRARQTGPESESDGMSIERQLHLLLTSLTFRSAVTYVWPTVHRALLFGRRGAEPLGQMYMKCPLPRPQKHK